MVLTFICATGCNRFNGGEAEAAQGLSGPSGTIATIAGTGLKATNGVDVNADGIVDAPIPALQARFDTPMDVTMGPDRRLYIVDWNGHKVRAMGADGMVAFVAGTGVEGDACRKSNPDGTCLPVFSEFNHMTDVAFDSTGRMVVAAWHNSKIKRIDLGKGSLMDLCGTGDRKFEGDGGPCKDSHGGDLVSFDLPSGVVYDRAGNLFISDQANQIIRRIGTDGIVKTVAGHCPETPGFGCPEGQGYSGDGGPATLATLNNKLGQGADPQGKIAMDAEGNLYIADTGNNAIRRVTAGKDGIIGAGDPAEEIITTIAGTGTAGHSGDGGLATKAMLHGPRDVAAAPDGTVYIADTENNCVRKVDSKGTISTVAGRCGQPGGFAGDGGPAADAILNRPYGVAFDEAGNLYITDTFNNRIREVYK